MSSKSRNYRKAPTMWDVHKAIDYIECGWGASVEFKLHQTMMGFTTIARAFKVDDLGDRRVLAQALSQIPWSATRGYEAKLYSLVLDLSQQLDRSEYPRLTAASDIAPY